MRTNKELLALLIDVFENPDDYFSPVFQEEEGVFHNGICKVKDLLRETEIIDFDEGYELHLLIRNHKPSPYRFPKFTVGGYWIDNLWWWKRMIHEPRTKQIRINFLKAIYQTL